MPSYDQQQGLSPREEQQANVTEKRASCHRQYLENNRRKSALISMEVPPPPSGRPSEHGIDISRGAQEPKELARIRRIENNKTPKQQNPLCTSVVQKKRGKRASAKKGPTPTAPIQPGATSIQSSSPSAERRRKAFPTEKFRHQQANSCDTTVPHPIRQQRKSFPTEKFRQSASTRATNNSEDPTETATTDDGTSNNNIPQSDDRNVDILLHATLVQGEEEGDGNPQPPNIPSDIQEAEIVSSSIPIVNKETLICGGILLLIMVAIGLYFLITEVDDNNNNNNNNPMTFGTVDLDLKGRCEGNCNRNSDCLPGLQCYYRGPNQAVPGCLLGESDATGTNYCILALKHPERSPSLPLKMYSVLGLCSGNCLEDGSFCETGLECSPHAPFEAVPGCLDGELVNATNGYCVLPKSKRENYKATEPVSSCTLSITMHSSMLFLLTLSILLHLLG